MASTIATEREWARECARRAQALGVCFKFDPRASTAYTDGTTVTCPTPPKNPTAEDFTLLRGSVIHECGHVVRKEIFDILKKAGTKGGSPMWALSNMIEDEAQERAIARQWPGDEKTVRDMWTILMRRQIDAAGKAAPVSPEYVETSAKLMGATAIARIAAGDWQPRAAAALPELLEACDKLAPGTNQVFTDLMAEGWADKVRACESVTDSWECAKALHKRLFPNEPQPQDDGGEGQGQGDQPKPAERSGGEARPDNELTKEEKAVAAEIPWQVILASDHGQQHLNGEPAPSRIDWSGKPRSGPVGWYTTEEVTTPSSISTAPDYVLNPDPFLISDIRRRLQVLARRTWQPEQLEGRLDPRNAPRVIMPRVGDGTYNRSIFKQRTPKRELDTAVTVLVDCSGSMSGKKHICAAQAAVGLYDLFNRALRVPCEVLGFTTDAGPHYWTFKTFQERRIDRALLARRLTSPQVFHAMSGNADGDAILWAWERIAKQRSRRKVIIVLSDGSPSNSCSRDPDATLIAAIKAVRGSKGGEVYGIGIMDTNVRRYYSPKAPVIDKPGDVTRALIETLADILQKRPGSGY